MQPTNQNKIMTFHNWGETEKERNKELKPGLLLSVSNQQFIQLGPTYITRRVVVVKSNLVADILGFCLDRLYPEFDYLGSINTPETGWIHHYFSKPKHQRPIE